MQSCQLIVCTLDQIPSWTLIACHTQDSNILYSAGFASQFLSVGSASWGLSEMVAKLLGDLQSPGCDDWHQHRRAIFFSQVHCLKMVCIPLQALALINFPHLSWEGKESEQRRQHHAVFLIGSSVYSNAWCYTIKKRFPWELYRGQKSLSTLCEKFLFWCLFFFSVFQFLRLGLTL